MSEPSRIDMIRPRRSIAGSSCAEYFARHHMRQSPTGPAAQPVHGSRERPNGGTALGDGYLANAGWSRSCLRDFLSCPPVPAATEPRRVPPSRYLRPAMCIRPIVRRRSISSLRPDPIWARYIGHIARRSSISCAAKRDLRKRRTWCRKSWCARRGVQGVICLSIRAGSFVA